VRLPFLEEVLEPFDRRYVWITRNPLDAAASAMDRWRGSTSLKYSLAKLRHVPARDLPTEIASSGLRRLQRLTAKDGQLDRWGPMTPTLIEMVDGGSPLAEICAQQWVECNQRAQTAFRDGVVGDSWLRIGYEDLVAEPMNVVAAIRHNSYEQVGKDWEDKNGAGIQVHPGRGRGSSLDPAAREAVLRIAAPTADDLGYLVS
jgi:hypothetical protein